MAVRMKDIARDLGVSVVTVSKVLRNHADISEETRERVLRRMKELNYQPNLAARALVTGRMYIVGLVVPDLVHPFFAEVAKGLSRVLREKGYGLVLSSSEEDPELERQEIDHLLARRVDALIIASTQWTVESFRKIEEQKTPYVLIDRKFIGLAANFVGVNDEQVGLMATEHLIRSGCRVIAHVGGQDVSTAIERREGYRRALARHGLELPPAYSVTCSHPDDSGDVHGFDAMQTLLALDPRPDGVFCYNDPTAMGASQAILEAGLNIPGDIAVVGCGNVLYSKFLRVPLTTVDQSSRQLGEQAGLMALSVLESKTPVRPRTVLLEPKLVLRESTRPLAPTVRDANPASALNPSPPASSS